MPADAIAVAQERLLVGVERGIDRIDGDDGGEQRGVALAARDEVAAGHERAAHAAVDRRDDPGELEIELGGAERGRDRVDTSRGLGRRAGPALALFERHGVVARQPVGPPHLGRGAIARGVGLRQLRAEPLDLRDEGTIVELEQQLARPDEAALLEGDVRDQARDARPDADRLHRLEAAGELIPFGDVAGDRGCRGHLRKLGRGGGRLDARAADEE